MKILKIKFSNINSLKGEHEVDFEDPRLATAGIFAITGATGAGKSTLLDVITLALFNRVPRFESDDPKRTDKSRMTKKAIDGQGSIVTHHCKSAYAEVSYEVNRQVFRSHWSIEKNRNGNWKDYDMELVALPDNEILSDKKREVADLNEQRIGLNYQQFVKSIILSQGQFSKFLRAERNERTSLLESITGGEIFRNLGIAAFEKNKDELQQLQAERKSLEGLEVLSETQQKELQGQNKKLAAKLKKLLKHLQLLTEKRDVKEKIEKYKEELNTFSKQQKEADRLWSHFKPQQQKIKQHETVSIWQGDIALYEKHWISAESRKAEEKEKQLQLKQAQIKLQEAIKAMADMIGESVTEDSFMPKMKIFEKKVKDLDYELKTHVENGKRERSDINELLAKVDFAITREFSKKVDPQKALDDCKQRLKVLKKDIKKAKVAADEKPKKLLRQVEKLAEEYKGLETLEHKIQHRDTLVAEAKELSEQVKNAEKNKKSLKESVEQESKQISKYEGQLEQLEKQRNQAIKEAEFEEHRAHLAAGDPCPLCGSLEHPYASKKLAEVGKLELERQKLKNQLKLSRERHQINSQSLAREDQTLALASPRQAELKKETESYQTLIKSMLKQGKLKSELELLGHMTQCKERISVLKQAADHLSESIFLSEAILAFDKLQKTLKQHAKTKEALDALYQGSDFAGEVNDIQDAFAAARENRKMAENQLSLLGKELKKDQKAMKELEKKLTPYTTEWGFSRILDAKSWLIQEEELEQIRKQKLSLEAQLTEVKTMVESAQKKLIEQQKKDDQKANHGELLLEIGELEIERDQLNQQIGANDNALKADERSRKKAEQIQKKIHKMEQAQRKWALLSQYIGDSTGNKFANFAQTLTLRHLLQLANKQLGELTDRYRLAKPADIGDLQVIDSYQGDSKRSVSTLSGGETFIVSLALALSLSELASQNVRLESLFIDEGFGTLDHETLDEALNTLEKLQSKAGKTIGVISHVESLKERITTQIRLEKSSLGHSHIEIVS